MRTYVEKTPAVFSVFCHGEQIALDIPWGIASQIIASLEGHNPELKAREGRGFVETTVIPFRGRAYLEDQPDMYWDGTGWKSRSFQKAVNEALGRRAE